MSVLYWAFGSNLDEQQMRERCPEARSIGAAVLPGRRLVFAGHSARWEGPVASVVQAKGERVEGLVYELTDDDLARLDAFEGHPHAYVRTWVAVTMCESGERRRAWTYALPGAARDAAAPGHVYLHQLARAYDRLGFDGKALSVAAGLEDVDGPARVFVYGTLRRGQSNHRMMERATFVGEAETTAQWRVVDLGAYPGMVPGKERVRGEVFAVGVEHMLRLDRFEGHPRLYRRQPVRLRGGGRAWAWIWRG